MKAVVADEVSFTSFVLEGKLVGPWVEEFGERLGEHISC